MTIATLAVGIDTGRPRSPAWGRIIAAADLTLDAQGNPGALPFHPAAFPGRQHREWREHKALRQLALAAPRIKRLTKQVGSEWRLWHHFTGRRRNLLHGII